jgi:hypothetical protein
VDGVAMTAEQARKLCQQAGAPLPPGMHAGNFEKVKGTRRKVLDGISFRSTLEADCYVLFRAWERLGAIHGLRCQPRFLLSPGMRLSGGKWQRPVTYVADFEYIRDGRRHVIDAKGFRMEVYRIKAKLFRVAHPTVVFEEWDRETLKRNGG